MGLLRVNTAVRNKTEEMEATAPRTRVFHCGDERRVREKVSVLNHQINAGDVHMDNSTRTNVEVPDFTVAHLAFGESDERPAGMNQRIGIFAQQAVIGGLASKRDCIRFRLGAVTPAVEDDEDKWLGTGHGWCSLLVFCQLPMA